MTVLIDLILPEGKINKYLKSIMSIVVIAVIISPVAKFVRADFDFGNYFDDISYQVDQVVLDNITALSKQSYQLELEEELAKQGFPDVHIEIVTSEQDGVQVIKYIYVDLCDFGISQNESHIDYYTQIRESLKNLVDNIGEDRIVVYG